MNTVRAVADVPVTHLVVPEYHGLPVESSTLAAFTAELDALRRDGDELALHGLRHLDDGPPARSPREWAYRRWYTAGEGEFAALGEEEARARMEAGRAWFNARGWVPEGFVAPAWLLGESAWRALAAGAFRYTTTWDRFHLLPERVALPAPGLVYSARSPWRRQASRLWTSALLKATENAPLLRLSLHPADAGHPALLRHTQSLLRAALTHREPMTKGDYARLARSRPNEIAAGELEDSHT